MNHKYAVVTTFSPKGYEVYGRRFIDTFQRHWPGNVPLYVYYEGALPADAASRATWLNLNDDQDRAKFLEENQDKPEPQWNYRFRIATYSHKVFAYTGAPRESEWLIWLDSDVEAIKPVEPALLHAVCPEGVVASYLGRKQFRHSETGFLAFRLNKAGNQFLDDIRRFYVDGHVKTLLEWHDCMVFDYVRRLWEREGARFHNLSAGTVGLRVFEQTPLGEAMRHHKGPNAKRDTYGESL